MNYQKFIDEGWKLIGTPFGFNNYHLITKDNQIAVVSTLDEDLIIPPTDIPVKDKKSK